MGIYVQSHLCVLPFNKKIKIHHPRQRKHTMSTCVKKKRENVSFLRYVRTISIGKVHWVKRAC